MNVLYLSGNSNQGKSTVIKQSIFDLIDTEEFELLWMYRKDAGALIDIKTNPLTASGNVRDIKMVLKRRDGKIFAVTSVGDDISTIKNTFEMLKRHAGCVPYAFVCACHPNSTSERWLCQLAKNKPKPIVRKDYADDRLIRDLKQAICSL